MSEARFDQDEFLGRLRTVATARRDSVAAGAPAHSPSPVLTWGEVSAALHGAGLSTRAVRVAADGTGGPVDVADLTGALPGTEDVVAGADLTWVLVTSPEGVRVTDLR